MELSLFSLAESSQGDEQSEAGMGGPIGLWSEYTHKEHETWNNRKVTFHYNRGGHNRAECLDTAAQERKIQVLKGDVVYFPWRTGFI